ncbi:hypothetical protein [Streptomyces sp. P9-A2]|uniref:hypothetical protein n=1 Tax=Streptomyces sp. P9-A2 TaxID=3072284 RepID=UPI002FC9C904
MTHLHTDREGRTVPPLMTLRGAWHMSDVAFIGLTVVVFALIGLAAKGVGRL